MCRANKEEAEAVKRSLDVFFGWSGHEANTNKSSILFTKNTTVVDRMAVKSILEFKEMPNNSIYLGNFLLLSRNINKDFKALKDRISQRIEGWNMNLLSKAGKATIVTSVIQAILSYTMSTSFGYLMVCVKTLILWSVISSGN